MAEDTAKTAILFIAAEVKRCGLCSGAMDDEDHEDGKCGFYKRLETLVIAANGGITVRA